MIAGIHIEVLLAASYAVFLVGVAALLEILAGRSHRRSEQYPNAGFTYHREFDLWECPVGQPLTRSGMDDDRRIVRYRAPASACNSCSLKHDCTDSDEGRELERHLDSWLDSEIRRFHRGLSLALLLLAALLLGGETVRHRAPKELVVVWGLLAPIGVTEARLFSRFLAAGDLSGRGRSSRG